MFELLHQIVWLGSCSPRSSQNPRSPVHLRRFALLLPSLAVCVKAFCESAIMGFDNECIVNIQSLPGEFFCPVCRTLVYPHEALQSQCTHLYCKPCLAYVVATTQACPYDGFLVTEADSKPLAESNKPVAESIGKVDVHCLYYRSGCQWQGTLTECTVHSTDCTYGNSLVVCNRCGAQIIHRQVQEHAQSCPGLQPQAQQVEGTQAQASSLAAQATTQNSSSAIAPTAAPAAAVPAAAPGTTTVPATAAAIAPTLAPASAVAAAPPSAPAAAQTQTVAQAPTSDQWYQQQLQYQQYYQQYPGYDPYQQQYQQYGQYQQQPVYQNYPYVQPPSQHQPLPYAVPPSQPQPQPQPQPQTQQPAPSQLPPQQPLPQAQLPYQPRPQTQTYPHPRPMQMQAPQAHVPPLVQAQPQPQPQSYPAPLQHQLHPQMQPPPQTQPTAPAQPVPNIQMQHSQAQPQFQHPPQPNVPHQPRPQLQPLSQPTPQTQTQPGAAVSGYQSYPQPQPFQQFPHSAPPQHHMHIPLQQSGPPQQQPQFLPQQTPQMRPSQAQMPMQSPQQLTAMPPQGRWPMQQQPPSVAPQPGQPPQYPPSLRPPVQQQLPSQYQHAIHPPSHPQGMPYNQHNLPQIPPIHQPQGPPGRSMMSNQGITQQALQQTAGLNHQVQSIMPASPATKPGISGHDVVDKKVSPKVADANIGSNLVNGVSEGSESVDANGKAVEKLVLSDTQIPSKGSDSLAKDEKVLEIKHEPAGEAGTIERHQQNGITNLKKEVETENEVAHPSSADKSVGSSDTLDFPRMQGQVSAPGRDSGFPQRPPHQDSIPGRSKPFTQPGYPDKNLPPEGPNSAPGRYPPHQVNLGQGFAPPGPPPDKAFPQQMPYASQDRKFMDPQIHPPPFGPNQTRPLMQHISENFPPQGPPRGFEQQVMVPQLRGPSHFPPSYDSGPRVPQGGAVVPPGQPTGGFNSLPGRPSDHPRRPNYPLEADTHVMRHPTFFDDKGPIGPSNLHDIREERLKPNPDGRFRPLPEESLKMAPQESVIPSMFEEDLKRFPRPSHLNGDPQFEPYASLSRPLDRGHDPRSSSLDRAPYGADGGFGVGGRRNHFVPPNDPERFRDLGDARGDVVRPLSEIGLHRLDGQLSSKFGSMSQYNNEDFYRRDLHGASAFYESRIPEHFGPGSSLLPAHIRRSNLDHPDSMRIDAPDFPRSHFHEPFGHGFLSNQRSGEPFRVGEPGFARSYMLGDSFEHTRKRKPGSMGWCRICKIDCETVEGLDMHAQTREHQKKTMDMVLSIKQEVSKKKLSGGGFSPDNVIKTRKANFEHRGTRP